MSSAAAASERWVDFHDVLVHCAYPPFAGDAFASLFAGFAAASSVASGRVENALHLELTPAPERRAMPAGSGWTPTFFYGLAQAYSSEGKHRLSDGESCIEIEPARSRLSGTLFEPQRSSLTGAMQHVALSVLLREQGIFDSHAASACIGDQALVILGDAGAGKTSTLLALLRAGAEYMGDDRLLLRKAGSGIELLAYPREFHISAKTLEFYPGLVPRDARPAADGKTRLGPLQAWPGRLRRCFSGRTVLLAPRIVDSAASSIRPLSDADAFGLLLASSATVAVEALPHRTAQLALLARLASDATAFELLLGSDFLTEPAQAAKQLLSWLSASHA